MRRIVFGVFIALMICIVLLSRLGGAVPDRQVETAEPEGDVTRSSRTLPAQPDPEPVIDKKVLAKETVAEFVAVYYARDARLLRGTVDQRIERYEQRLRPFVTESFTRRYAPPLITRQDLAVKLLDGRVTAEIVKFGSGHIHEGALLDQELLVIQHVDFPEKRTNSYRLRLIVSMRFEADRWRVEGIEERYLSMR